MITDKTSCSIIAEVLGSHGVSKAVVSPGSRCAPISLALDDAEGIGLTVVADERSAAFIALGMAQVSRKPVALVCTSGSALLNYAPAVAEAFYQGIPLIVISADRPEQWIDQDDSQTIRQFEALDHFVKRSYDIPDTIMPDNEHLWYANRIANDACLTALSGRQGPVHINVQLHAPLTRQGSRVEKQRIVEDIDPDRRLTREDAFDLARQAADAKILVVAGFMPPDSRINRAVAEFSRLPNVYILHETLSNLHFSGGHSALDTVIGSLSENEAVEMTPDLVITIGGALVSRFVKQFIREHNPKLGHWAISDAPGVTDCFKCLTKRISVSPDSFFRRFGGALRSIGVSTGYREKWHRHADRVMRLHEAYLSTIGWSDMKGMQTIFSKISPGVNLQLSNGTPVRYAQLLQRQAPHAEFCNRGVSGIDGCTSTAVGASMEYGRITLFISGDLSFSYDLSALACRDIPDSLRIIVFNNSGGGIFRFVATTDTLPKDKRESLFCAPPGLNIESVARSFGFNYLRADNESLLETALSELLDPAQGKTILEVKTDPEISAKTLKDYFISIKKT